MYELVRYKSLFDSARRCAVPDTMHGRRSARLLSLVPAVLSLALVGAVAATASPQNAQVTRKVFRIAQIGSNSGQNAALGDWDWKGIDLAARQIDKAGGIFGVRIHIDR